MKSSGIVALCALALGCGSSTGGAGGGTGSAGAGTTSGSTTTGSTTVTGSSGTSGTTGSGGTGGSTTVTGSGGTGGMTGSGGMAGSGGSSGMTGSGGMAGSGGTGSGSTTTVTGGAGGGWSVGPYDSCGLCAPGQLLQDGFCTQILDEPKYGCSETSMTACVGAPHRQNPRCNAGACEDGPCVADYLDCDGQAGNGCEAFILDPKTCGSCATTCAAGQKCGSTGCAGACGPQETYVPPYPVDACVNPTTMCLSQSCPKPHGSYACAGGSCAITCDPGFTMCGGECVDTQRDAKHCGGCASCPAPPGGGVMACVAGVCAPRCPSGLTMCGNECVDLGTDLDHCGACGAPCATGLCVHGTCDASLPRVLASGAFTALAVDATTVFFADGNAGTIGRVAKTGGAVTSIVTGEAKLGKIAADATHVYWVNVTTHVVKRAPKAGGAVEALSPTLFSGGIIAVDATDVFWDEGTKLMRAPKAGGAAALVATIGTGSAITDIVIDGVHVYFDGPGPFGGVYRTLKDGSGAVEDAGLKGQRIALDESYLYGTGDGYYGVARIKKDFSSPGYRAGTSAMTAMGLQDFAVGNRFVYLGSTGSLGNGVPATSAKALKCGGALTYPPPTIPAFSNPYGYPFVLDDTFVYGVIGGELRRVPQ